MQLVMFNGLIITSSVDFYNELSTVLFSFIIFFF